MINKTIKQIKALEDYQKSSEKVIKELTIINDELLKINKRSFMLNRKILRDWKHYFHLDMLFLIICFLCGLALGVLT